MATPLARVNPGELITASFMNQLVGRLDSLEDRVAALETTGSVQGGVVISGFIPSSASLRVGEELQVLGMNFGVSAGAHRVLIDDTQINVFKTATDQLLKFDVPLTIINVPSAGRPATLSVSNARSSAQRTILLNPAQPLTGPVDVEYLSVNPPTIAATQPATFQFRLRNRANLDATFLINPVVAASVKPEDWNQSTRLKVLDAFLNPLASRAIHLAPNQEAIFHVRIDPVPAVGDGTAFSLNVAAGSGDTSGFGTKDFVVGQASEPEDTTVSLIPDAAILQPAGTTLDFKSTMSLAPGTGARITFLVKFSVAGTYAASIVPVAPAANWSMFAPAPILIDNAELQNPEGKASKFLMFTVSASGTSVSGALDFQIQRTQPPSTLKKSSRLTFNRT